MKRFILFVLAAFALIETAHAQGNRGGNRGGTRDQQVGYLSTRVDCNFGSSWDGPYFLHPYHRGNPPYDGRVTLTRVWYAGSFKCQGEGPGWAHDFPLAETNFVQILRELTILKPRMDGFNVIRLDSPELFKYPALYFSEAGGWEPTEKEVVGFRNYLLKGGFVIFDDLPADGIVNTAYQIKRAFPKLEILPIPLEHPIFDSFFHITEPWMSGSGAYGGNVDFYALYEDNDPEKRVMAVFNYNNDLGEKWQFAATGMNPIGVTNESYKLGINYYIYALTK